jgi:hypothetical protein
MAKNSKKIAYVEPMSYFSKEARKAAGIGEFAPDAKKKSSGTAKKTVKRK